MTQYIKVENEKYLQKVGWPASSACFYSSAAHKTFAFLSFKNKILFKTMLQNKTFKVLTHA